MKTLLTLLTAILLAFPCLAKPTEIALANNRILTIDLLEVHWDALVYDDKGQIKTIPREKLHAFCRARLGIGTEQDKLALQLRLNVLAAEKQVQALEAMAPAVAAQEAALQARHARLVQEAKDAALRLKEREVAAQERAVEEMRRANDLHEMRLDWRR